MKLSLTYYFLLFMIYSMAGWLLEITCKYIDYKKIINRGFLIGPYCPIYGYGAILITLLLYKYKNDPLVLFLMTVITCGVLEYLTSWIMEKLFKARWWDYSKRKFNINGRICLGTLIPFGVFGIALIYITNPFIIKVLNNINLDYLNICSIFLFIIYMVDNVISVSIIFGFRKTTVQVSKQERQDDTEQITKKVKEILIQKSWTYKRLINAYPKLIAIKTRIKEISNEVKENATDIKNNITERAEEVKNNLNEKRVEVINTISEKKEDVKTSLTQTGKRVSDGIYKSKKIIRINYNIGKKRIKNTFKGKKINK